MSEENRSEEIEPDNDRLVLPVGSMVNQYRIIRAIGAGGMAAVYAASSIVENEGGGPRERALKFLLPRDMQEGPFQADYELTKLRFEQEAEIGKELPYPGIVKVYTSEKVTTHNRREFDSTPRAQLPELVGIPFLVLERLYGETLDKRIARGCLEWSEAARLIYEITEPLSFAHHRGICHRDIKPENIFLLEEPKPKSKPADWCRFRILDWGIAKPKNRKRALTVANVLIGTPNYVAPEQARGQAADQRSDIYALCSMLYYIIAGRFPVELPENNNPIALRAAIAEAKHRDIRQWVAVPDKLAEALKRGTHADPDQRYQSAAQLRDELGNLLAVPRRRAEWEETHKEQASVEVALVAGAPPPRLPVEQAQPKTLILEMPEEPSGPKMEPAAAAASEAPSEIPAERSDRHEQTPPVERSGYHTQALPPPPPRRARGRALAALAVRGVLGVGVAITFKLQGASSTPAIAPPSPSSTPAIAPPSPSPSSTPTIAPSPSPSSTPSPTQATAPSSAKAAAPVATTGHLSVWAKPYAIVSVDGRTLGETPLRRYALKPGTHTVELAGPNNQTRKLIKKIEPGHDATIRVDWSQPQED